VSLGVVVVVVVVVIVVACVCFQAFEAELAKRKSNIESIQRAASDVMQRSDEDTSLLQAQLIDLISNWDKVSALSINKQQRLAEAYAEVRVL